MASRKKHRLPKRSRRGAALVEFAVCAPVIALLAFGTIDTCGMIYLKQSLTIAAYEGGRTSIARGTVEQDAINACQAILDQRRVKDAKIVITPEDFEAEPIGTYMEVAVTAPCDANAIFGSWFYAGRTTEGRSEFRKKY